MHIHVIRDEKVRVEVKNNRNNNNSELEEIWRPTRTCTVYQQDYVAMLYVMSKVHIIHIYSETAILITGTKERKVSQYKGNLSFL